MPSPIGKEEILKISKDKGFYNKFFEDQVSFFFKRLEFFYEDYPCKVERCDLVSVPMRTDFHDKSYDSHYLYITLDCDEPEFIHHLELDMVNWQMSNSSGTDQLYIYIPRG